MYNVPVRIRRHRLHHVLECILNIFIRKKRVLSYFTQVDEQKIMMKMMIRTLFYSSDIRDLRAQYIKMVVQDNGKMEYNQVKEKKFMKNGKNNNHYVSIIINYDSTQSAKAKARDEREVASMNWHPKVKSHSTEFLWIYEICSQRRNLPFREKIHSKIAIPSRLFILPESRVLGSLVTLTRTFTATNGDNKLRILHLKVLKMVIWITNTHTQDAYDMAPCNVNIKSRMKNWSEFTNINLNNCP